MSYFTKLLLRLVSRQIRREIHRIALEKENGSALNHQDSDCGFQLLEELNSRHIDIYL
jgi:hypothetical protein